MDSSTNIGVDPRFMQGRALLDAGLVDDAIDFWGEILRQVGEDEDMDELNFKLAPIYYEYGNALLLKSEEAADMFGEAVQKAEQSQAKELESDSGGGDGDGGGGSGLDPESLLQRVLAKQTELADMQGQAEEDVEVAWENLDVARAIYEKAEKEGGEGSHQYTLPLAKVYLRLGDLSLLNGNFVTAVQDLEHCLFLRLKVLPPSCRALADVHHTLAQACLYAAADKETTNPEALREQSLSHYQTTADIFRSLISEAEAELETIEQESGKVSGSKGKEKAKVPIPISEGGHGGDSNPKKRASEFRSILQELQETIDSAKADQKIMMEQKETADNAGKTTVGFDQPSSSASSSQTVSVPVKKRKKPEVSESVTTTPDISNTITTGITTTTVKDSATTTTLPTTSGERSNSYSN